MKENSPFTHSASCVIPILLLGAMLLVGCQHSEPVVHHTASARVVNVPGPTRPMLITTRGTNTSPEGAWRVVVSEEDGSIHMSRLTGFGGMTMSPKGWTARQGWFAYIENGSRVWAYDGDRQLYLLSATEERSTMYGPREFPFPVPEQVFSRLSAPAQQAIEKRE